MNVKILTEHQQGNVLLIKPGMQGTIQEIFIDDNRYYSNDQCCDMNVVISYNTDI